MRYRQLYTRRSLHTQSELPQGTENLSAFAQVRSTLSGNA